MATADWLAIATYATVGEAEVAASALRAAGIECLVRDGHTAAAHPDLAVAMGYIGLLVHQDDADEARELIAAEARFESESGEFTCAECSQPLENAMAVCARCNAGEEREVKVRTPAQAYWQAVKFKFYVLAASIVLFLLPFFWDQLVALPETFVRGAAYGAIALIAAFAIMRYLKQSDERL